MTHADTIKELVNTFILKGVDLIDHASIFLLRIIDHCIIDITAVIDSALEEYTCMIYKIYTFQYEANQFIYGLGKGHQQYIFEILVFPFHKFQKIQWSLSKVDN